ncbi:amino acid adenylation domain-containing protein [Kitasatospora aureofaciens]|uniref:amino acid adenylation domain-containing protein n=1 Tax=Kitasatospora aureofaciens TaxID=1894 RepID=UPI001C4940B9|nr:amino acid adenylation domain-containing protein [Kitasatospora aureofaciens]MBV6701291.1 amino acid adenylation domain-containing protein [Kitasatospora aureofaciens]
MDTTTTATTATTATTTGVPGLIRARVLAEPTATALRTAHGTVSYGELWQRAERTADTLRAHGVRPGDIVTVRLPSGPEAITAMLGVWLAGAAFLPVDIATPEERRAHLLRHSRAVALIDSAGVSDLRGAADGVEPWSLSSGDPAYVIYTSGSTGTPKGVLVGHAALAGHVDAVIGLFGLTGADTVLQFASIGFDVAQEEIWPTLAAGGTLAFHGGGVPDAEGLSDTVRELGVTILQLPTAYWRMLCAELDGADRPSFGRVRTTVIGGENATAADARAHHRTPLGHTTLVNGYGPTETVVTATALVIPPHGAVPATGGLPIGGPVGARRLHVLDDHGRPAASGEPGELWIGGPLLAAGYLHDPRRTEERFRPDPFDGGRNARMYRTGDLVLRHPDGNLEFLGRVDNQVKIRGHRVELDEVDRHLLDVPGVTSAVAFTLDDGTGGQLLAAAVTLAADGPGPEAVRERMRERVPGYLVPGRIAVLDRLPLTTSGKIDRRASASAAAALLATTAPAVDPAETAAPALPPLDETVQLLRGLLQAPWLGPDDDFLAHGGDSLMAMRVCSRMRSRGLPMRPADLLAGRTARSAVTRAQERTAPTAPVEAEPAGSLSLLPAQQRWLYDGELAGPDHFCLNALFTVDPGLGAERLTAVAGELLRRHPALRTALDTDGTARLLEPDTAGVVECADLRAVPAPERGAQLEAVLASAQTSMSLAAGRVFRLLSVELGDGTARLLMTVHHFVLDGVSMGLLVDDLEALLAGGTPEAATAGPRAIGTALRSWLDSPEARQDAASWAARTGEFATLKPALDGPDRLPSLRVHRFRLDPQATRLVTHALPADGIAPHDFTLGCLVGGLARWTGEPVHGVDVYAHSRDTSVGELDLSRTVGYVQSTFPAVLGWSGGGLPALRAALAPLGELPERRYGFDALRFGSPEPAERTALDACQRPSVRLNFRGHLLRLEQRAPGAALRPADEGFGAQRSPLQRERYLLMAEGDIVAGELELSLKYSTGHWSSEQIEALADEIGRVMTEALAEVGAQSVTTGGVR